MSRTIKTRNRAVTLVEVMMVLGIMSILLGLALTVFGIVQERSLTNQTVEEVFEIMQGIYDYKNQHGSMEGMDGIYLSSAGLIPSKYVASRNLVLTPHGGQINFNNEDWTVGGGMTVWLNGLTKTECIALVQLDMSQYVNVRRINWEAQYNQSLVSEQGGQYAEQLCNMEGAQNQVEFNSN